MTENGTTDRIVKGRAVYARNFGVTEAKAEALMTERAGREFTGSIQRRRRQRLAEHSPDRPRPQHRRHRRTRKSNVTDERLTTYLAVARRNGVDERGLTALMVLLTAYIGQPFTSLAMETVQRTAPSVMSETPEGNA
jgi:4-carboxymuconolactone decarboxylase